MDEIGENSAVSGVDVFEKERIELESERLKLALERLDAREEEIAAREAALASSHGRDFALPPIVLLVAAVLLIGMGAFLGTAVGFDLGREHSVKPRTVLLSRAFIDAISGIDRAGEAQPAAASGQETIDWTPRRRASAPPPMLLLH